MADKHRKTVAEAAELPIPGKRRKVAVKLSLDPNLVREVRAGVLRDGFSLSAHVSRLLREDLDRAAATSIRQRRG
jgi:hypothetical protein